MPVIGSNIDTRKQLAIIVQSNDEDRARVLRSLAKMRADNPKAFDGAMAEKGILVDWEHLLPTITKGQTSVSESDLIELLAEGAVAKHLNQELTLEEFARQRSGGIMWGPRHSRRPWNRDGIKKAHQRGEYRYDANPHFQKAVHDLAQVKLNDIKLLTNNGNSQSDGIACIASATVATCGNDTNPTELRNSNDNNHLPTSDEATSLRPAADFPGYPVQGYCFGSLPSALEAWASHQPMEFR